MILEKNGVQLIEAKEYAEKCFKMKGTKRKHAGKIVKTKVSIIFKNLRKPASVSAVKTGFLIRLSVRFCFKLLLLR